MADPWQSWTFFRDARAEDDHCTSVAKLRFQTSRRKTEEIVGRQVPGPASSSHRVPPSHGALGARSQDVILRRNDSCDQLTLLSNSSSILLLSSSYSFIRVTVITIRDPATAVYYTVTHQKFCPRSISLTKPHQNVYFCLLL